VCCDLIQCFKLSDTKPIRKIEQNKYEKTYHERHAIKSMPRKPCHERRQQSAATRDRQKQSML